MAGTRERSRAPLAAAAVTQLHQTGIGPENAAWQNMTAMKKEQEARAERKGHSLRLVVRPGERDGPAREAVGRGPEMRVSGLVGRSGRACAWEIK